MANGITGRARAPKVIRSMRSGLLISIAYKKVIIATQLFNQHIFNNYISLLNDKSITAKSPYLADITIIF